MPLCVTPWPTRPGLPKFGISTLAMKPDGVFLSNGPGDPEPCDYAIAATQAFLKTDLPLLGISLGHQILGLATGARTVKMKFGHHGANHPVQDLESGRVLITSQNHGFAVDAASLPRGWAAWVRNANDGSNEGVRHKRLPVFGVQFHPEACPGPTDTEFLFNLFLDAAR